MKQEKCVINGVKEIVFYETINSNPTGQEIKSKEN